MKIKDILALLQLDEKINEKKENQSKTEFAAKDGIYNSVILEKITPKNQLISLENNLNNYLDLSEIEISDIAIDSRLVKKNSIFFALQGKTTDGAKYIATAINQGAIAVIASDFSFCSKEDLEKIIAIKLDQVFELLVKVLNIFYPSLPQNIYAVTGTNGKTTVVEFGRQILQIMGLNSASIGTLGVISDYVDQNLLQKTALTTPDIVSFYKNLAVLKENGIDDVFIEASSIGLEQNRISGLGISAGAFTNFSQDHLDYHKSMEKYFDCKMLLFSKVLKENYFAVINSDILEYGKILEICKKTNLNITTYGYKANDFKIHEVEITESGEKILFEYNQKNHVINLDVVGDFQAHNILCSLALILIKHKISDDKLTEILKNFSQIKPVSGRMQKVATLENKARIFIDFAHSPDALKKVLLLSRNLTKARIIVLFGCGGNRDALKRPIMGEIACDLADLVIVTDDNPRLEDAAQIRKEILVGCDANKVIEIANRKEAIQKAIKMLQSEDILILAGKGHEKYQVIGNEKFEFDEEKIVKDVTRQ